MPPIFQQAPPRIAFSKNKISLVIHSDTFRASAPVAAVSRLLINSAIAEDTLITIKWATGTLNLVGKIAPDDSGLQIPAGDGSAAHANQVLTWLRANPVIDRNFIIIANTAGTKPYIEFTARSAGPEFSLIDFTSVGGAVIISNPTPGISGAPLPNFCHYVSVLIRNAAGDDYYRAFDCNVDLDNPNAGNTSIDISRALHAYLSLDIPSLTGSQWQLCKNSIRKYLVKTGAFYGDPGFVRKLVTSDEQTVVYGGYSNLAVQQIADMRTQLGDYLLSSPLLFQYQRWFEAWPVDSYTVKTNQPQFLYFINSRPIAETFKIKVDITFVDGTTQTITIAGGTLQSMEKVCIGCGYQQLGLNALPGTSNVITSYEVRLVEAVSLERRTVKRTFYVDRNYEAFTRYFLYSDSAGNFKTLRTYGTSQLTAEINAEQVSLQTDPAQIPVTGNYQNSSVYAVHNDTVNTGYISSAADYDALIELHLAKQVFRVIGNVLIPIVITSKNFNYSSDGAQLQAGQLEYRLAYDDDLYTADSSALNVPQLNASQQPLNDI